MHYLGTDNRYKLFCLSACSVTCVKRGLLQSRKTTRHLISETPENICYVNSETLLR